MHRSFAIIITVLMALSCSVKGQDTSLASLPQYWTLQQCIEYARTHNISVATLRLTARSTQEDLLQSKAAVLPDLNGSVSQNLVNGNNSKEATTNSQPKVRFSGSYGLSSSIVVYQGGYLRNDIKAKQFSLQSANLTVKEAENSITLSITQAFFNILLAKETVGSFDAVLSTSTGQLKQGQYRYNEGAIAKKELLQLESQVATDDYNLTNAMNTLKLNTVDLKQLLQLPSSFDFKIAAPDSINIQQEVTALPEAQRLAMQTRPEVKNKEVAIKISEVELLKSKAALKPTISVGAGLATDYSNGQSAFFLSQLHNNFYQSLGVNMSVPIYSRRVNRSNINRSKIQLEQSKLALYDTKTTLDQLVEGAYINLLNAHAQYTSAAKRLKTSEQIYFITNEQLKLGAVTTVELLQIKNEYVEALENTIQAKYNVALYNAIYEFYMGIPVSF